VAKATPLRRVRSRVNASGADPIGRQANSSIETVTVETCESWRKCRPSAAA
jgi:hypothetical protein